MGVMIGTSMVVIRKGLKKDRAIGSDLEDTLLISMAVIETLLRPRHIRLVSWAFYHRPQKSPVRMYTSTSDLRLMIQDRQWIVRLCFSVIRCLVYIMKFLALR